jgi:hypothetical protein
MHGNKPRKRPSACGCIEVGHERDAVMGSVGADFRHQDIRDQVVRDQLSGVRDQVVLLIPDC